MRMIQVDEALALFSRQRKAARQKYNSFMNDGLREHCRVNLSSGGRALDPSIADDVMSDNRILGGGHFVEQVLNSSSPVQSNHDIPLAELVQRVADALQIAAATLSIPCKERDIV